LKVHAEFVERLFYAVVAVLVTHDRVGDFAVLVDDVSGRDSADMEHRGGDALAVIVGRRIKSELEGVLALVFGNPRLVSVFVIPNADAEHDHILTVHLLVDRLDMRHRTLARAAPGGPKVEDDDFASVVGELQVSAAPLLRRELRSRNAFGKER